jgi:hypothetical protein
MARPSVLKGDKDKDFKDYFGTWKDKKYSETAFKDCAKQNTINY